MGHLKCGNADARYSLTINIHTQFRTALIGRAKYVFEAIQPADTLCNSGCEARLDILIKTIDLYNQSRFPIRTKRIFPNHADVCAGRSEEHTSELQSRGHLVCRL